MHVLKNQIIQLDQQISAHKAQLKVNQFAIINTLKQQLHNPVVWMVGSVATCLGFRWRKHLPFKKILNLRRKLMANLLILQKLFRVKFF